MEAYSYTPASLYAVMAWIGSALPAYGNCSTAYQSVGMLNGVIW